MDTHLPFRSWSALSAKAKRQEKPHPWSSGAMERSHQNVDCCFRPIGIGSERITMWTGVDVLLAGSRALLVIISMAQRVDCPCGVRGVHARLATDG